MKIFILVLFLFSTSFLHSQNNIEFLHPSPTYFGMGETGVAAQNFDAGVVLLNPALAGYFAKNYSFGYTGNPSSTISMGLGHLTNNSIFFGHNLYPGKSKSPISIGLGYSYYDGDFDSYFWSLPEDPVEKHYQRTHTFSVGVSYEYFIQMSLGFNYKKYLYFLDYKSGYDFIEEDIKIDMYSIGLHLSKDIAEFIPVQYRNFETKSGKLFYNLNFAVGAVYNNMQNGVDQVDLRGNEERYYGGRSFSLGYSFDFNFSRETKYNVLDILELGFEANSRQSMGYDDREIGDIAIGSTLFSFKSVPEHNTHLGTRIALLEVFEFNYGYKRYAINSGSTVYHDQEDRKSLGFSTEGISKIIVCQLGLKNGWLKEVLNNVSIKYYKVENRSGHAINNYDMYSLNIKSLF